MKCRHCRSELDTTFADLGSAPPSNAYITSGQLRAPEKWYPLRVLVCTCCWLVQTEDCPEADELFTADYAYFSSFSASWLDHCENYVAHITSRLGLTASSRVIEVAANDGYLLQYFKARAIPCLGIEPTSSTAAASRLRGIETIEAFFGTRLARELVDAARAADLMVANNVLAHVPDINDFVAGFAHLLRPTGVATFEFPHLLRLVAGNQFDTIYHEHFSYLSLTALDSIFRSNGLRIFDVEELNTHGGSLRVYARRSDSEGRIGERVYQLLSQEAQQGITTVLYYTSFQRKADRVKNDFLTFLIEAQRAGKKVAAYGAAAKGNTLLNYAGIRSDLIGWVADRNPAKQGKYLPGSRIPVVHEATILAAKPDYIVILPWNLRREITDQLAYIGEWGGKFITAIPEIEIQ